MTIAKPMLGEAIHDTKDLPYPLGATYKADGIRALKLDGQLKSRSLKPIRNAAISSVLVSYLPDGADGEIIAGDTFQDTTSAVMTEIGSANYKFNGTFYWFDWVKDGNLKEPYMDRCKNMERYLIDNPVPKGLHIVPLLPRVVNDASELDAFNFEALEKGFEGVIVRKLDSPYKCGRSTLKQAYLLKLKGFEDAEATIVGFQELMHNENEAKLDERGYTKRSSHKDNLVQSGTLGSFKVIGNDGVTFNIGTGLNAQQRQDFWDQREQLLGKLIKYKFFAIGCMRAPRFPTFIGFRDVDDM